MKQYVVDAFTDRVFAGNPAAVCVPERWPEEALMRQIARENNLSETAFAVKEGAGYRLRWFTPGGEIDLCGHATLATAFVLLSFYEKEQSSVRFATRSGELLVEKRDGLYEMDFPAYALRPVPVTAEMTAALGAAPQEAYLGRDLLCVFREEAEVRALAPDAEKLLGLEGLLLHATAPGKETDCVSRSFGPKLAIAEDPVCGSGHCHIVPYWAERLGKERLVAYQASRRGGTLYCRMAGRRVCLSGRAALFSAGELFVDCAAPLSSS
ncbi:MAG: PhzF family phenazine biosynthesis protein [Oscillospiraceae bacterium]